MWCCWTNIFYQENNLLKGSYTVFWQYDVWQHDYCCFPNETSLYKHKNQYVSMNYTYRLYITHPYVHQNRHLLLISPHDTTNYTSLVYQRDFAASLKPVCFQTKDEKHLYKDTTGLTTASTSRSPGGHVLMITAWWKVSDQNGVVNGTGGVWLLILPFEKGIPSGWLPRWELIITWDKSDIA